MTLRVLQVIPTLGVLSGGPVVAVVESARALGDRGVETTVVATDLALPAWTKGQRPATPADLPAGAEAVKVVLARAGRPYRLAYSPTLLRDLRERAHGQDVVHIHSLYLFPQFAAGLAARAAGTPYIVSPRGALDPWLRRRGRLRKRAMDVVWQRRLLERAALLHVTTEDEARLIRDVAPDVPRRVVPNGIFWSRFQNLPDSDEFRRRYLEGHTGRAVLSLGRLTAKKGLDILVEAFGRIASRFPDTVLVLAGPDDGESPALRRQAAELGIAERVFFTGMLLGEDKLAALEAADVWALPSHTENFGIAVVEAMAAGVAVVVSPAVNLSPDIAASNAGLVVPAEPGAFAAEISELLDDAERRRALGESGRLFSRAYDWSEVAARLEDMYRSVAEARV